MVSSRRRERETKELRALQQARKGEAEAQAKETAKAPAKPNPVNTPAENGFVFSTPAQPVQTADQSPENTENQEVMAA